MVIIEEFNFLLLGNTKAFINVHNFIKHKILSLDTYLHGMNLFHALELFGLWVTNGMIQYDLTYCTQKIIGNWKRGDKISKGSTYYFHQQTNIV